MKYGFDLGEFYIELPSIRRAPLDFRSELEQAILNVYNQNKKIALCLSAGIDSQVLLASLKEQSIPFEAFFFHMPYHNDNEKENLKLIEKKFGVKINTIVEDPLQIRRKIDELSLRIDVHPVHALQAYFINQIPHDYDIIQQGIYPPDICDDGKKQYIYYGYHNALIARQRAVESFGRKGKYHTFNEIPELYLSYLSDPISEALMRSWLYFKFNGLQRKGSPVNPDWAFDLYVKPLLYAKYWRDEIIYFPKYQGSEKLTFWHKLYAKEKVVPIPYYDYIKYLKTPNQIQKFYQLEDPLYKTAPWI